MKTKKKYLSLLMALLLCVGIFSGCSDTNSTYDDEEELGAISNVDTTNDTDETVEAEDVIGEVTYVGTSYLSLSTYESESEISDYATLDMRL